MSSFPALRTEIPNVLDRLTPLIGRLRLLSQYLEQPGVTELDAAADMLGDSADQLEVLVNEVRRANEEIRKQHGCCGRVEVVFHAA